MNQNMYHHHILYSIILWDLIGSYKIYKNNIQYKYLDTYPVFKIRSETCRTEARFCENLYMIKKESLPNLAGPTQILPVNVRGPALILKTAYRIVMTISRYVLYRGKKHTLVSQIYQNRWTLGRNCWKSNSRFTLYLLQQIIEHLGSFSTALIVKRIWLLETPENRCTHSCFSAAENAKSWLAWRTTYGWWLGGPSQLWVVR